MVLDVALGNKLIINDNKKPNFSLIKFIFNPEDLKCIEKAIELYPNALFYKSHISAFDHEVTDSSTRMGFAIYHTDSEDIANQLESILFN